MSDKQSRTVVISEVHPYEETARYGGHQYARVFAKYGWRVILLTANFNLLRLLLPSNRQDVGANYINLWRARGEDVNENLRQHTLAHILPVSLRYSFLFSFVSPYLFVPRLKSLLHRAGVSKVDLLWLHGDGDWLYREVIPHSKLIVRVIDDYESFGRRRCLAESRSMKKTLSNADVVTACSHRVKDVYRDIRQDIAVIPNGVDLEHFTSASYPAPMLLKPISRPRAVYVGAVADWFDFGLLSQIAARLPHVSFVIVGNWQIPRPDPEVYPSNIHIVGPIVYDKVPDLLHHSDVGLVPFKKTPLVEGVSPIKVYEYLASGLPVVALQWHELEVQDLPIILAEGVDEFVSAIKQALRYSQGEKQELSRYAQRCSWEQRLKRIMQLIDMSLCSS